MSSNAAAWSRWPRGWFASSLARNTGWMTVANGWRLAVQAAYFVLIARMLGVSEFGRFAAALAIVSILAPFAALGSGNLMVMHVAKRPSAFADRWGMALISIPLFGIPLALVTVGVGHLLVPAVPFELIAALCLAEFFVSRLCDSAAQAFQASERMAVTATLTAAPGAARLAAVILAFVVGAAATAGQWAWWYLAATCVAALVCYVVVHALLGRPSFDGRLRGADLREGAYFSVAQAAVSIYTDIDKALLARLGTLAGAGVYAAAYRATALAFVPILSMLYATYARFFRAGEAGIRGSHAFARKLLPFSLIYSAAAGVVLFVAAPLLPLVLGSDYRDAAGAVRWLSALPLIQATYYLAGDVLTGAGRQGIRSAVQAGAAVLNVVLCYVLIPPYGWRGAAWATLVSLGALSVGLWVVVGVLHAKERARDVRMRVLAWPAFDSRNKNPYNRLLYDSVHAADSSIDVADFPPAARALGAPHIWHIHWPEQAARSRSVWGALLRSVSFAMLVLLAKVRGTRVVWTIHNVRGHDSQFPRVERRALQWLSRRVDGFIVLSSRGREVAVEAYPALRDRPYEVVTHGSFVGVYPDDVSVASARDQLGLLPDQPTVVFVGRVNGYKGVVSLVRRFRDYRNVDARLVVAGEPASARLEHEVREAARADARIRLELRFIEDDELQIFLRAADLIALPYADVSNSSSVMLALSFGRPVLVPSNAAMLDLADDFGSFWIRTYEGELEAADLEGALRETSPESAELVRLEECLGERYGWPSAGENTAQFYRRLVATE